MAVWLRFTPDRAIHQAVPRMYVCWTDGQPPEAQMTPRGAAIGEALGAALDLHPQGFVVVEADVAYDSFDQTAMEDAIARDPGRAQMAPYWIWPGSSWRDAWGEPESVVATAGPPFHWQGQLRDGAGSYRQPVEGVDRYTDVFSLGLTYIPGGWLRAADQAGLLRSLTFPGHDVVLSEWFADRGWQTGIVWACRPKHLHFIWAGRG